MYQNQLCIPKILEGQGILIYLKINTISFSVCASKVECVLCLSILVHTDISDI
jgi:hypothetical protein